MIKIHKYEAVGIAVSICAMSLALFLMRFNGTLGTGPVSLNSGSQSASVIMAEGGAEGVGVALSEAMSGNQVKKVVATDITIGNGQEVKKGSKVEVNYIATLQNGQEFDNTYKKGSVYAFALGDKKVIAGLNEGLLGMKAGGQRIIIIPADKAFGKNGYGPVPANATVVYAVELVSVK